MRYLLIAAWILLSTGAASADWNEVMRTLERVSGPNYDVGTDPGEPEWIATRKARFENERARLRGANLESENPRDQNTCRESTRTGRIPPCK